MGGRRPARLFAVLHVVVAGFLAGFPMGCRLAGDTGPADLQDVMVLVAAFPVFVLAQLVMTVALTRLRSHRPVRTCQGAGVVPPAERTGPAGRPAK